MQNRGTPFLYIPDFSLAISSKESPKISVCSLEMVVIAHKSALQSLEASNLPPRPVSIIALSTLASEKAKIETMNVISKYVGNISGFFSAADLIWYRYLS